MTSSSKKFVSDKIIGEGDLPEPSYRMVWHSFGSKEYSGSFMEHLKEAEAKALKQAREKALLMEKEAYEKGFAQGEKDGLELGRKRIETIEQQMTNLFKEILSERESLYRIYERDMLLLILSISRKILYHEIALKDEVILETLRGAFKQVVDQRKVVVRLNPIDFQFLDTHCEKSSPIEKGWQGVKMIKDPSITKGGCRVETAFGEIDGTIEGQFDQIVSLLWDRVRESERLSKQEEP